MRRRAPSAASWTSFRGIPLGIVALTLGGATTLGAACSSSSSGQAPATDASADAPAPEAGPHDATTKPDSGGPTQAFCSLPGSFVAGSGGTGKGPDLSWLQVPQGFCVHYFGNVGNARQIRFAPGGEAFVASPTAGTTGGGPNGRAAIVVLTDDDHDGYADATQLTFLSNLPETQGLLFDSGSFYYQDGAIIRKMPYAAGQRTASGPGTQVAAITEYVSWLHWPKPLDVADDGTLYVGNAGDQDQTCYASRPFTGGILKLDGTPGGTEVTKGFRNPMSIHCQRGKGRCYAIELTQDFSEDAGGREKVLQVSPGDVGYPCCATASTPFAGMVAVNDAGIDAGSPDCSQVLPDILEMHVGRTPISFDFVPPSWPSPWAGRTIVSLHGEAGSWNGAEVIAFDADTTGAPIPTSELGLEAGVRPAHESGFAAGWDDNLNDHGRPDDMAFAPDGRLFLTNDATGDIVWFAPVGLTGPAETDAGAPTDAAVESGPVEAGASPTAVMRLLELTQSPLADGGTPVTVLDARVAFGGAVAHDYDDRTGRLGCFADHYVASSKPAPADGDAGSVSISGFAGGTLLDGHPAASPIAGTRSAGGYYQSLFPGGDGAAMAPFPAGASPLGAGPIVFTTGGGAQLGAVTASSTPTTGAIAVTENLNTVTYTAGSNLTLDLHGCVGACVTARVTLQVVATSSTDTVTTWPYSRVGRISCDLKVGGSSLVSIPTGAIAAMLASDAALDTFTTSIALLPGAPAIAHDANGNVVIADTGRGAFGIARH